MFASYVGVVSQNPIYQLGRVGPFGSSRFSEAPSCFNSGPGEQLFRADFVDRYGVTHFDPCREEFAKAANNVALGGGGVAVSALATLRANPRGRLLAGAATAYFTFAHILPGSWMVWAYRQTSEL